MDVIMRIKTLTEERNWSQYRLAKEAELPQTTIANIFHRGTTPSIATLETLCKAFNISLSDFFMEENDSNEHISAEEKRLLSYWKALNFKQQKLLMDLAEHMNENAD